MINTRLMAPFETINWIDRNRVKPNDYNPNKVSKENLRLLTRSMIVNGWTLPIVVRPDMTIVDGFHRWMVTGPDWTYTPKFKDKEIEELGIDREIVGKTLFELLNGKVLIVIVKQNNEAGYMYGTITHNRARGTHLLEPMKAIVQRLIDSGKTVQEIGKHLGMRPEEVFRLSNFSKEDFLKMLTKNGNEYSKAEFITKI